MRKINLRIALVMLALCATMVIGGTKLIHSKSPVSQQPAKELSTPIIIAHKGNAVKLDRAPVVFDHDTHTKVLLKDNPDNCALCHVVKEKDTLLVGSEALVFKFPKKNVDMNDKPAIMAAYHNECINCHKKMSSEGKKSGPEIGMCGKCHDRKAKTSKMSWSWKPIFNYKDHAKHLETVKKLEGSVDLNIAGKVQVVGDVKDANKNCMVCHHLYDEKLKKLYYKENTENSCSSCHKATTQKNVRSIADASHAACIGCHMKVGDVIAKERKKSGRKHEVKEQERKTGPIECKGCHGDRKSISLKDIALIPRLDRGQKDVMDLTSPEKPDAQQIPGRVPRMKVVPFNHKSHEPRVQFCNSCHHHSLEKCSSCHTLSGDTTKGGGISYEQAFHLMSAKDSCAGCHQTSVTSQKCYGCHQWRQTSVLPQSSCPVCHQGPSLGKFPEAPQITLDLDKEKFPEKVMIKGLEKEFKAVDFPHAKIANKLNLISNESSLARSFHAARGQYTICFGCHHGLASGGNQPNKFPACATCHGTPFNPTNPGKLGTLGAYHRQCIGCHQAMNQKPLALECVKCHAEKKTPRKVDLQTTEVPPKK
jgi:hypothetical protein